jgi:TonB-linked SusC/RagA family outer membrane protein|tara:strand:+ start:4789 stop:7989 length:3201 start_codon:yes stop_codon:yes gene_type:complete
MHRIIPAFLVVFGFLQAQQISVSGVVTTVASGEPLIGVNIVVQGSSQGTTTDIEGFYSIDNVASDAVLAFSFIGYETAEVNVEGRSTIDVALGIDVLMASEELIVTGYKTERKVDLTGAVSVVELEPVANATKSSPLEALQGRIPGVYIEQSGRASGEVANLLVRGLNTLGNNSPLFVIDGVPTTSPEVFSSLDINTIGSVQVLKDASAASIYGARAANGVIIVTTKSGEAGRVKVSYTSKTSSSNYNRRPVPMTAEERGAAMWQASLNDGTDPVAHAAIYTYDWNGDYDNPVLNKVNITEWVSGDASSDMRAQKNPGTNWQNETYRTGQMTDNTVTISGGNENSQALLGLGYLKSQAVMRYQDFEKMTLRLNSTHKVSNGLLTVGQNLTIASTSEVPEPTDLGGSNMDRLAQTMQATLPVYTESGDWAGPLGAGYSDRNSPVHMLYIHRNNRDNRRKIFGNLFAEISPIQNLRVKSSFGLDYTNSHDWWVEEAYQTGFLGRATNSLDELNADRINWTFSNTATYDLKFGDSRASVLLGTEAIKERYHYQRGYKENFVLNDDYDYILNMSAGTGLQTVQGTTTGFQLLSYFGKVNYSFANRYLASATLRYDGSSRFGPDNAWGAFPAFTVGWRINNEPFFNVDAVSNLKLRIGYGRVGNQEIGNEARFGLYKPNYSAMGDLRSPEWTAVWLGQGTAYDLNGVNTGTLPSGFSKEQTGNAALKWETTDEVNVGVDFGFNNETIFGSFDYFTRETKDILIKPPSPAAAGEGAERWENGATIENAGFELALGLRGDAGPVSYNVMAIISQAKDKITYLPDAVVKAYAGNVEQTIIGRSQTSIFGYESDGIFQNQAEVDAHGEQIGKGVGRVRYVDRNGDGKVDSYDQMWLGTSLPDAEYGLNVELRYNDFTLTSFLSGVAGWYRGDSFMGFETRVSSGMNFGKHALENSWTAQNPDRTYPALSLVSPNDEGRTATRTITNHSYFKLRNLQLSWRIPSELRSGLGIPPITVYVLGENLWVTYQNTGERKFWGQDPESLQGVGTRDTLLDRGQARSPLPTRISFGFNWDLF